VPYTIPASTDTTPPSVTITVPLDGATVARKSTVTISATASDNVGVTRVEFYVDGQLTCADGTASYTGTWKVPAANGHTYQLQAKAYDAQANVRLSNLVTVTAK
jgi:hypothetical protein